MGSCVALRGAWLVRHRVGRLLVVLMAVPVALLDISNFPGSKALLSRWSPIGQLAYGDRVAAHGFQYTAVSGEKVRVDWAGEVTTAQLVSTGVLFARLAINGRDVFVDRRCGAALVRLWGEG